MVNTVGFGQHRRVWYTLCRVWYPLCRVWYTRDHAGYGTPVTMLGMVHPMYYPGYVPPYVLPGYVPPYTPPGTPPSSRHPGYTDTRVLGQLWRSPGLSSEINNGYEAHRGPLSLFPVNVGRRLCAELLRFSHGINMKDWITTG